MEHRYLCHRGGGGGGGGGGEVTYIIHLYCLAVQAGFYSDVLEC